ncbi:uncharacterized protein LOC132295872 [Cornus florida]|uniref:uncharacterized protein LOC132295872 n=1 Tax=Cornus florida TaxID=4283 RepID=UPI00289DF833|nr:uncharacterized protein LOC132295872 [Cornus florida]
MTTTHLVFGFHPGVNDYKVVRIKRHRIRYPAAEVYSLSTGSWRRIDVALDPSYDFICHRPAILNGAAYWVASKKTIEGICRFLVRFEMGDEVFEELMLPDGARHCYPYNIAVLGESLYLFGHFPWIECCGIWTMEGGKMGSWTKRFTFNFRDTHESLLCMRKSGELLHSNHADHLLSYNFETQRTKDLGYHGLMISYSYVESLIQLDGAETLFPLDNGNPAPCELARQRRKRKKNA